MIETIHIGSARSYPPRVSQATRPFWRALSEGRWITTRCDSCGKQTFPPKAVCPHCWSASVAWADLGATGTVYSWTRIHAAPMAFVGEAPYSVCIVDLDCGIRLACRLIDAEGVPPHIGMPVRMVRLQYTDGDLFAARPVSGSPVP